MTTRNITKDGDKQASKEEISYQDMTSEQLIIELYKLRKEVQDLHLNKEDNTHYSQLKHQLVYSEHFSMCYLHCICRARLVRCK